jgi:hypothetical protein
VAEMDARRVKALRLLAAEPKTEEQEAGTER